jgi:Asp-tRNA(Asn)/Glu-tRNA(Gln) amidotransferase A subunit family amidase
VVGHKPTFGLVPKLPGFKGWPTLSVDGPLARTVRDAALALAVMAGPAAADPLTYPVPPGDYVGAALHPPDLRGLRVAYTADLGGEAVEPVVRQAFAAALERFADLGCDLVEDHPYTERPVEMWNTIALAEGYASEGPLLRTHARRMTPGTADIIRAGAKIRGGAYVDAQNARAAYTRSWAEFLERYDLLLMPAMPLPAFSVGVDGPTAIDGRPVDPFFDDWCVLALPANLTGMPSTSVPIGRDVDGLPIGLQIMGRRWADAATLGAAAAYERVAPWRDDWPPAVRALD